MSTECRIKFHRVATFIIRSFIRSPGWSLPIGQNGAFGYGNWSRAIRGWHNEVELFTYGMKYSKTSNPPWYKIGHYTQVRKIQYPNEVFKQAL